MCSIIIYLLVTLCVANASIVTISVYDEPDQESAEGLSDCNFNECAQMCRRLGFPDGACVNGRCKCDNFKNALDNSLGIQSEVNTEVNTLGSCNNQECDQRCRRLKFPGGVCVNGRCKCDLFRNIDDSNVAGEISNQSHEHSNQILKRKEEDLESYENEIGVRAKCNANQCHKRCIRADYYGGVCRNGKCYCYR